MATLQHRSLITDNVKGSIYLQFYSVHYTVQMYTVGFQSCQCMVYGGRIHSFKGENTKGVCEWQKPPTKGSSRTVCCTNRLEIWPRIDSGIGKGEARCTISPESYRISGFVGTTNCSGRATMFPRGVRLCYFKANKGAVLLILTSKPGPTPARVSRRTGPCLLLCGIARGYTESLTCSYLRRSVPVSARLQTFEGGVRVKAFSRAISSSAKVTIFLK